MAVSPEAHIETQRSEPEAAPPPELDLLALVPGNAATYRQRSRAVLGADVQNGAPSPVQHVRANRCATWERIGEVGDVRHGQPGVALHMIDHESFLQGVSYACGVPRPALDPCVGPGELRADIVDPRPDLERARYPHDAEVAADPVTEGVPELRVGDGEVQVRRHGVVAGEDRVAGREPGGPAGRGAADARVVVNGGAV